METKQLIFLLIIFRCVNALLVQTFFDPDEYWQSLEVAHNSVFGYGYLTWEWRIGLRSFLHPAIFAVLYKAIQLLHLDNAIVLIVAPKILQGMFAAIGDYCLYMFSKREFGASAGRWTLAASLLSWFMFDVIVRTYSNSLETIFVEVFLFFWPSRGETDFHSRSIALALAAVTVVIRPTSALLWAWFGLRHLFSSAEKLKFLSEVSLIGFAVLVVSALVDFWFFQRLVFPPLEFFKFNVLFGGASIYGTHPWHWFFSNAFPTILTTLLLPLLFCLWRCARHPAYRAVAVNIFAPVLIFAALLSVTPHKEFRFLLPVLPLCLVACGVALRDMEESFTRSAKGNLFKAIVAFIFVPQIIMAIYFSSVHQRGTTDVMAFVRNDVRPNSTVVFLMPCHSTPYHAYVHRTDVTMRFLDCSPNLERRDLLDEADRFYEKPLEFLAEYSSEWAESTYFVMFDGLAARLEGWLTENNVSKVEEFFHAHIHEGRVGGAVEVFYK